MPRYSERPCKCGSGEIHYPLLDGRGIFLDYVCSKCEEKTKKKYRPEIFDYYTEEDVDERIEPEE